MDSDDCKATSSSVYPSNLQSSDRACLTSASGLTEGIFTYKSYSSSIRFVGESYSFSFSGMLADS